MSKQESRRLAVFQTIAHSLPGTDWHKLRTAIHRKLQRSNLDQTDNEELEVLRRLHDEIRKEILKFDKSEYFRPGSDAFASLDDFDLERMARDFGKRYPTIGATELAGILGFAVYYYYLR